jgi:hypothetical protein
LRVKGKPIKKSVNHFDVVQKELQMGIEMEHTDDRDLAMRIALDHLAEIPDYYTRLKKMERKAGAE